MSERPLLALTVGDPAGIGPESAAAAWADPDVRRAARLVVLGPEELRPASVPAAREVERERAPALSWYATATSGSWVPGRAQASAGAAALAALRAGAALATRGAVDGLVTAPVSKEALHLAGERVEGQTQLLERWSGAQVQMLSVAHELRIALVTRHLALTAALAALSPELVLDGLQRLDRGLRELGFRAPHLALAGLNPHASEGGLFGSEERELLEPAVARARELGLDVSGPLAADSVFVRAARGEFDAVLALYHDQAFIPAKLHAPDEGLTVLLGLPYLRVSPAHGTAFDRVGTGTARPRNLIVALLRAAEWARARRAVSGA